MAVDRAAIEDDQYGQVAVRIKSLAMEAKAHIDQLTFGLLSAGFTTNCYDGTPFFGTHPLGKNSGRGGADPEQHRHRRAFGDGHPERGDGDAPDAQRPGAPDADHPGHAAGAAGPGVGGVGAAQLDCSTWTR